MFQKEGRTPGSNPLDPRPWIPTPGSTPPDPHTPISVCLQFTIRNLSRTEAVKNDYKWGCLMLCLVHDTQAAFFMIRTIGTELFHQLKLR